MVGLFLRSPVENKVSFYHGGMRLLKVIGRPWDILGLELQLFLFQDGQENVGAGLGRSSTLRDHLAQLQLFVYEIWGAEVLRGGDRVALANHRHNLAWVSLVVYWPYLAAWVAGVTRHARQLHCWTVLLSLGGTCYPLIAGVSHIVMHLVVEWGLGQLEALLGAGEMQVEVRAPSWELNGVQDRPKLAGVGLFQARESLRLIGALFDYRSVWGISSFAIGLQR